MRNRNDECISQTVTYEFAETNHGFRIREIRQGHRATWMVEEYHTKEFPADKYTPWEALLKATHTRIEKTHSGYYQVWQSNELVYDEPADEDMYSYQSAVVKAAYIVTDGADWPYEVVGWPDDDK